MRERVHLGAARSLEERLRRNVGHGEGLPASTCHSPSPDGDGERQETPRAARAHVDAARGATKDGGPRRELRPARRRWRGRSRAAERRLRAEDLLAKCGDDPRRRSGERTLLWPIRLPRLASKRRERRKRWRHADRPSVARLRSNARRRTGALRAGFDSDELLPRRLELRAAPPRRPALLADV